MVPRRKCFPANHIVESGATEDFILNVKQQKCSRLNGSQQLKRLCRTIMPDISSTNVNVAVINYKCYKKK
ncbi:hypothetical protein H5410_032113 [Solanum commersonii]|uniref:Uncharacterized protein n=1 Tax=Solanum commersonii TaxID=4109 RepID=A0A9J5YLY0_SOLCO|nr:hypothetical protein H5410_032113 [Solanum commersonii]